MSRPIYDLDREHSYRFKTTYKAVQLNCLDPDRNAIDGAYGTGVIVEEESGVWLYTCWHLITGFDPARIKIPPETTIRAFLLLRLMSIENDPDSIRQTGDTQIEIVPLYLDDECKIPAWKQDAEDTPHADLNAAGLKVPKHHDSAKLKVSSKFAKSGLQTVVDTGRWPYTSEIGSPLIVVGYPYGYSTTESLRPSPIALTRNVASIDSRLIHGSLLLDGGAAPGMSGSPVFAVQDRFAYLMGLYTGILYPDHIQGGNDKYTVLGRVCPFTTWWILENNLPKARS